MDFIIELLGRERAAILALFIGVSIQSNLPKRVSPLTALKQIFTPFFIILCLLNVLESVVGFLGYELATKALIGIAGISGWMSNWWVAGFERDGKKIKKIGSAVALLRITNTAGNLILSLIKKMLNLK